MEFRTDLTLRLKTSCDACSVSKVKCSGDDPCSRCVKKGVTCFYSPKKKRGPAKKRERAALVANQPILSSSGLQGNTQMASLGAHERRSWSVFFSLYKHYAVSCSLFWFNRQLHRMRSYLMSQGSDDALRRLNSWMAALSIDVDELAGKVEACQIKIKEWGKEGQARLEAEEPRQIEWRPETARQVNQGSAPFHLRVNGSMPADAPKQPMQLLGDFSQDSGIASLKFAMNYTDPQQDTEVVVNQAFEELMGYDGASIASDLEKSGGGFLPWGADLLGRMLTKESDLLSFVQVIAIKVNSAGRPESFPIVREVPSVHVFDVIWKRSQEFGPMPCVIKCIHREVISDHASELEVYMSFEPVGKPQVPRAHMLAAPQAQAQGLAQPQPQAQAQAQAQFAGAAQPTDASAFPEPRAPFDTAMSGISMSDIIPDSAIAILEDNIELPPKRARQHSSRALDVGAGGEGSASPRGESEADEDAVADTDADADVDADADADAAAPGDGASESEPVIYKYTTVQEEIREAMEGEEHLFTQAQTPPLPPAQAHPLSKQQPVGPASAAAAAAKSAAGGESQVPQAAVAAAAKKMIDGDDDEGALLSPDAYDDNIDILPFVDSDEEESLGVAGDDAQWLDELLQWTGPAVV